MALNLQTKNLPTSPTGMAVAAALRTDSQSIETEVNNLDIVVAGLTANVTTSWVSGTVYAIGDFRRSPINFQTYRRLTNGAGTTDPSSDPTNWVAATAGSNAQPYTVGPAVATDQAVQAQQIQAQAVTAFTTGGTSTAFTLTPTPALAALAAGQRFRVKFNATAGATPTLAISGLAAHALMHYNYAGTKIPCGSSSIVANMLSDVEFDGTDYVVINAINRDVVSVKEDFGATGNGTTDDYVALQQAVNNGSAAIPPGIYRISTPFTMAKSIKLCGYGHDSVIDAAPGFTGAMMIISPTVGNDPKGWAVTGLNLTNSGAATNVFTINLATSGKYVSKLKISDIVAASVSGYFVELINSIPNIDGLFTSVFEDNWSMNGYYMSNSGDSLVFQRNTVTGSGRAFYINQLGTASQTIIRDNNITSAGGALLVDRGSNLEFSHNQVEAPVAHTGTDLALVNATNAGASLIANTKIRDNNINTQANTALGCIYLNNTESADIDGNTLYTYPGTGNHITIGAGAQNTYIGLNKYYSSTTGAEITPLIVDNGIGTMGIWKNATLASWSLINPANGFSTGFFKTRDGVVMLRGNLNGTASTVSQTLFTLPVGFRPLAKVVFAWPGNAAASNTPVQILPTGEVQIVTAGNTSVYLDGLSFSTR